MHVGLLLLFHLHSDYYATVIHVYKIDVLHFYSDLGATWRALCLGVSCQLIDESIKEHLKVMVQCCSHFGTFVSRARKQNVLCRPLKLVE